MTAISMDQRASGVLLHLTSLPGPHGNGDLGPEARAFVDFLAAARQRFWQMLPLNSTGLGHSPYSGVSAFAGDARFISLLELAAEGLLTESETSAQLPEEAVDYDAAAALRRPLLQQAHERFRARAAEYASELAAFRERTQYWLPDYALFMAIRQQEGGNPWTRWPEPLALRDPEALANARHAFADVLAYFEFEQFTFDRQFRALRAYANEHGVGLIGDAPIFVAHDSAEVWARPRLFRLDAHGEPSHVSGVPPDYFSETGQRWGTPLYDWDALAKDGFRWWVERFRTLLSGFDIVRLDHFIGFARYWEIPAEEETAVNGQWRTAPGVALFEAVKRALGHTPFIAEDLGSPTAEVFALRDRFALPGMRVLQFAFGWDDPQANDFLPHNYVPNTVAYTGTHDNDTSVGWFYDPGSTAGGPRTPEQAETERKAAIAYLVGPVGRELRVDVHWEMIRSVFASVARTAIVPMQDLLGLGSQARMNRPGQSSGNWIWRVPRAAIDARLTDTLRAYTRTYGRCDESAFEPLPPIAP